MKYYIVLGLIVAAMLGLFWASSQTTEHNVKHNKEVVKAPKEEIIPPHKIVEEFLENLEHEHAEVKPTHPDTHKHEEVKKPVAKALVIPVKVANYLKDDVIDLKIGMTKKEVDALWGEPDDVRRSYDDGANKMTWNYGEFLGRKLIYENMFNYKIAIFENGTLDWWRKDAQISIKTHHRNDVVKSHLDEGVDLKKGMSKTELYKLWGLPYDIDITCFSNTEIRARWVFDTDDRFSHWAEFINSKLTDWGDVR
jgi:hypothetical protein